jgi:transcriptional regulator with XRE-family HTH domain
MVNAFTSLPDMNWNAETVRGLRKFLRLSQSAFSKEIGVRQQTISEWETGVYEPRGASSKLLTMIAVGAGYGTPTPQLFKELAPEKRESPVVFAQEAISTVSNSSLGTPFPPPAPSTTRIPPPPAHSNGTPPDPGFTSSAAGRINGMPGSMSRNEVPM